jgi:hypothetical protein
MRALDGMQNFLWISVFTVFLFFGKIVIVVRSLSPPELCDASRVLSRQVHLERPDLYATVESA